MTLIISWRIVGFIAPAGMIRNRHEDESDQMYFLLHLEYMCRSDRSSLHRRGRFLSSFQKILTNLRHFSLPFVAS